MQPNTLSRSSSRSPTRRRRGPWTCDSTSCRPEPKRPPPEADSSAVCPATATATPSTCTARTSASSRTRTRPHEHRSSMGRKAAIAGVYNTAQGRRLEGETTRRLIVEAVLGALADAGLTLDDVDGITSEQTASLIYDLRLGPVWQGSTFGIGMVAE